MSMVLYKTKKESLPQGADHFKKMPEGENKYRESLWEEEEGENSKCIWLLRCVWHASLGFLFCLNYYVRTVVYKPLWRNGFWEGWKEEVEAWWAEPSCPGTEGLLKGDIQVNVEGQHEGHNQTICWCLVWYQCRCHLESDIFFPDKK